MKKKLFYITNFSTNAGLEPGQVEDKNYGRQEDHILAELLRDSFNVRRVGVDRTISALKYGKTLPDAFLLRNVWPFSVFEDRLREMAKLVEASGIPFYNPVTAQGGVDDKRYLVDMTQKGMAAIPTVLSKQDISLLGNPATYIIKPIHGCSSEGLESLTAQELAQRDVEGYVIQPKIDFACEVSLVFIDRDFQYAVRSKSPEERWDLSIWQPTQEQIRWAQSFVDYEPLAYGLQRIDAALMPDGRLFLMELERTTPYLSLELLEPSEQKTFARNLANSLSNVIEKRPVLSVKHVPERLQY